MTFMRTAFIATVAMATLAIAGCSGSIESSQAGAAAGAAAAGADVADGPTAESDPAEVDAESAGEPPADCPVDPGLPLTDAWEATTEEQDFQISHQCIWTAGEFDAGDTFTLFSAVVPRPSGMEGPAVAAFEAAPCEGGACLAAATAIEDGALARGVQPDDDSVSIFYDNPGKMDINGTAYEWIEATAWVVTDENMCYADLGARMSSYDPSMIDPLLADLHDNAAAICGVTA